VKPRRSKTMIEKRSEPDDRAEINEIFSASEAEVKQFFEWFDAQRATALFHPGERARKGAPSKAKG